MTPTASVMMSCWRGKAVTCAIFPFGSIVSNERVAMSRYIVESPGIGMRCADGMETPPASEPLVPPESMTDVNYLSVLSSISTRYR